MTCQKMNRRELFNYINEISFAVDDTKLFLDTHPWDQRCTPLFSVSAAGSGTRLREYASHTTVLLRLILLYYSCADRWYWINEPWPWQEGGC